MRRCSSTPKYFDNHQETINSQILWSQTPQGQLYPSYRYNLADFLSALPYASETGMGRHKFYTGKPCVPKGVRYCVINAVLFLTHAYKEAIQYDACGKNNWELVNGHFPIFNSCGQLGRATRICIAGTTRRTWSVRSMRR